MYVQINIKPVVFVQVNDKNIKKYYMLLTFSRKRQIAKITFSISGGGENTGISFVWTCAISFYDIILRKCRRRYDPVLNA